MPDLNILSEFIPDLIGLSVDVIICGVLYKVYSGTLKQISAIKDAPEIDLDESDVGALFKDTNSNSTIPYIVVSGKVAAAQGTNLLQNNLLHKATSTTVKGVIKETSIIEHNRTLSRTGFWYDSSRTLHSFANDLPFWLIPFSKKSIRDARTNIIEVKDFSRATRLDLEVVSDHFEAATGGIGEHIAGFVLGDRPRGIQTTERMLLEGSRLTAIGELVRSHQGKIKIQQPTNGQDYFLIKDSVNKFIEDLQAGTRIMRLALFLFSGVGMFIAGFAAYRYWEKVKELRRTDRLISSLDQIVREQESSPPRQNIASNATLLEDRNSQTCVICLSQPKNVIFLKCGHVASCSDCARQILRTDPRNPLCPICRSKIEEVMSAFIA